jgi:hypothetical protein
MRPNAVFYLAAVLLLFAGTALAGTFIVPDDKEMVKKADAIVIGTVEGAYAQEADNTIETVYEIRLDRAVKGVAEPNALIRVVAMGGVIGDRGVIVSGEAQYEQGERVLVFLTRDHGRWRTTDLTLGKFKFATTTTGERLLVRDMDDVLGWDRSGAVHHEPVRKEEGFLRFVQERAHGRAAQQDYSVDASEVMLPPPPAAPLTRTLQQMSSFGLQQAATAYDPATYTSWVNNTPTRWPNISAGVTWYKRSDQNISGAADGGVSTIQNGLAAWTNECGSNINLLYGGQTPTVSKNFDSTNVVEFNDPQGRVSGSWTGAGTVAITFMSFGSNHTFLNRSWLSITDADVVFQDGFPATSAAFAPAMTHELGHGIGWRHSNQNHINSGACDSTVEECTSAAIMNSSVNGNYGFTLQPWDIHAAEGVYPGGTCGGGTCTPPSITAQPTSRTVAAGISTTITATATGTGLTYEWYVGATGNTTNRIPGVSGPSLTVTPGTTTSYWVRVVGTCGTANSNSATVTVTAGTAAAATASKLYLVTPCRTLDTRSGSPLFPASTQLVAITGRCGVPSGAKAIVMNITAVSPLSNGTLVAYPGTGGPPPNTSTVSYRTGRTRANNSIMRLSSDGRVSIYNSGPSAVHFLIDVTGYFQ